MDDAAWVDDCLAAARRTRLGALRMFRERLWATIYVADTDDGRVWLKSGQPSATEVALYPLLASVAPDRVLVPLGVDVTGGRLLLPDAGPTFGERFSGPELTDAMCSALRAYARLQLDLAPHVEAMSDLSVADMRPAALPGRFDEALTAVQPYLAAQGDAGDYATFERLTALRNAYAGWCAELAESGVPASLDHNDLHGENVVGAVGYPRFYDWGDSVLAHPFASLLMVCDVLPAESGPRLRDAYLGEFGDPRLLAPTAALACRVGLVARSLMWLRALGPDAATHEYAPAPFAHLRRLLD